MVTKQANGYAIGITGAQSSPELRIVRAEARFVTGDKASDVGAMTQQN